MSKEEKVVNINEAKDGKKKELKDCSNKELIRLIRQQHDHIKSLTSDVEYVNAVNKANNLLIASAMLELDRKILRIKHETEKDFQNNYVLHWDREEGTKDMLLRIQDREEWLAEQGKVEDGTDQDNATKSTPKH